MRAKYARAVASPPTATPHGYLAAVAKSSKSYVVWVGAKPGIYDSWPEASAQVAGFPGARYKSYPTRAEAERAYRTGAAPTASPSGKTGPHRRASRSATPAGTAAAIIRPSLSVDAACSGNPGKMEYQGVDTATKDRVFHQAFALGTNNIGEFLALVHGLAWCKSRGLDALPIYSDSKIAIGWIKKRKCKTTLPRGPKTEKLHDLIERGEAWLQANTYRNPILKWETERWGEIPADFGRK